MSISGYELLVAIYGENITDFLLEKRSKRKTQIEANEKATEDYKKLWKLTEGPLHSAKKSILGTDEIKAEKLYEEEIKYGKINLRKGI